LRLHTNTWIHPWLHFGLFFLLGVLAVCATTDPRRQWQLSGSLLLLGLFIEYAEKVKFQKDFEPIDVLTDWAGVLLGALLTRLWSRRQR